MELYLKITYLNDFIFCPLSIYYHQLYGDLAERLYYSDAQCLCLREKGHRVKHDITNCLLDVGYTILFNVVNALLKALNLGQINENDFWKNQNQYILTWKHSAKYVEIFIKAIMEYKNEIFYRRRFCDNIQLVSKLYKNLLRLCKK